MIYNIILIIYIIFIIAIVGLIYTNVILKPILKNNNISFMSQQETKLFFSKDNDKYVSNLSSLDLYARKVSSTDEYITMIEKTSISFTDEEIKLLARCVEKADIFFRNAEFTDLCYKKYINGNDIANIKWKFANTYTNHDIVKDIENEYEEGLPHTREEIIFLSKKVLKYIEDDLIKTLIHEKIHIYQRLNKELFDKIIKCMGFNKIELSDTKYVRSNPDTNRNIYIDNKTQNTMICLYRNDKPNGINDVIMNNHSLEHPYEKMAYEIADYYYYNKEKYKNI
jgi:hypothetical protein